MLINEQMSAPVSCLELSSRLQRRESINVKKLLFQGVGQRDVYNIAAPFQIDGRQVLAGRVEARDVENSEIFFFTENAGVWQPISGAMTFPGLQDPCITFVGGELILGGVRFPVAMKDGSLIWRMEFYRGTSLTNLKLFLVGPDKMKDIRLVELADEQIGVLTRPQGPKGGRGKIGYFTASNLEAITAEAIQEAPLFRDQCLDEEWVGANEAHLLKNGMIGILGHIACFDRNEHRHYYAMAFCVDPRTGRSTAPEVIASRADFPAGSAKRPDVVDVMFSSGLIRHGNGVATLYAGLSDIEAGSALLPDPFNKFETGSPMPE